MKRIEAIINPERLDCVKDALVECDIKGMTITKVLGFGSQSGKTEIFRGAEFKTDFVSKMKLEIVCTEENCSKVEKAIIESTRTGEIGDGKIFIFPNEETIRISNGQRGKTAI